MLYTEEAIIKRKQKAQAFKQKISIVVYFLIIVLLIYNISLIIQAVVNPSKTPSFFGIKTYSIISGSMEPDIHIGDIVLIKESKNNELYEGDIIAFRQGQSVITHRIIMIKETENGNIYTTKGDNNNTEDKIEINIDLIEGKVIGRIPFLGKISRLLQGNIWIIVMVLMVYIYFSHTSKVNSIRNRRKAKRIKYEENNNGEERDNNENK